MKKKSILLLAFIFLLIAALGIGVYFLLTKRGNTDFEREGYTYEAPARFQNEDTNYGHIFKINEVNVMIVDVIDSMNISCKGYEEMRKLQCESDEECSNVTTMQTTVNGYPTFMLEADMVSDGDVYHMYQYYIFAEEMYMEVQGIFESGKSDKYEKYVDAIAASVWYTGEKISHPSTYEDEDFYIELPEGFKARRWEQILEVKYIAADDYKRGFSGLQIEKLAESEVEAEIQRLAERYETTPYEDKLLNEYDATCVYRQEDLPLLSFESVIYFIQKDDSYYRVTIGNPYQDESCKEVYLDILNTWNKK